MANWRKGWSRFWCLPSAEKPLIRARFWKSLWVRESRRSEHRPGVWGDFEEMGKSGVRAVGGSKATLMCAEGVSEVGWLRQGVRRGQPWGVGALLSG